MPKNNFEHKNNNRQGDNKRKYYPRPQESAPRARASVKVKKPENFITLLLIIVIIASVIFMGVVFRTEIGIAIKNIGNNSTIDIDGGNNGANTVTLQPTLNEPFDFVVNETELEVHYLDVGQGDSIFIRLLKINKNILIDAGSGTGSGPKEVASNVTTFISGLGVTKINYFIASHADSDHINLADDILKKYEVENIYYNDIETAFDKDSTASKTVQDTLEDMSEAEPNATIIRLDPNGRTYEIINTSGYKFTIYSPGMNNFPDDNDMSNICVLEYLERRLIFTGDATKETEEWFIELQKASGNNSLDCDVLKVGHHGANTSSSQEFIDFLTPEYGVISVSVDNSYGHPHPLVMNRLFDKAIVTYRTNRHGNISLCIDSDANMAFIVDNPVPTDNNRLLINQLMIKRGDEAA